MFQERPFMCETCGFSTHTKSAMIRHNLSHTGEKPHICDMCGSAYADKKRLRDHKASQHSTEEGYGYIVRNHACDFCGFSSRRKDNLRAHIRRVHPELSVQIIPRTEVSNQQLPISLHSMNAQLLPTPTTGTNALNSLIGSSTKAEESKPEIRLVSSSILVSPKNKETSFAPDSQLKANTTNICPSSAQELFNSNKVSPDRSHIVGHINQDGSIRPVASATPSHSAGGVDYSVGGTKEVKGGQVV